MERWQERRPHAPSLPKPCWYEKLLVWGVTIILVAPRISGLIVVWWGGSGSSGFSLLFASPLRGRELLGATDPGCRDPWGHVPVPDSLGALGQAFQLAGPDLSGGLSSREINRGGGLQ